MRILFHVGHGKTGSSAIQSFLALNADLLADYGIRYPANDSFEKARKGHISSGNIFPNENWSRRVLRFCQEPGEGDLLFSNERLAALFVKYRKELLDLAGKHEIEMIFYIRDPVDNILSAYGQAVKRGGETGPLADWVRTTFNQPQRSLDFLRLCREHDLPLTVRNYSRIDNLERDFTLTLLGDRGEEFFDRAQKLPNRVNRSLSRAEYELQRNFNREFGGAASSFIADTLVNELPQVASEYEYVSAETLAWLHDRFGPAVEEINALVGEEAALSLDAPQEALTPSQDFRMTSEHLSVLASAVARLVREQRLETDFVQNDWKSLFDIAQKFETGEKLALEDAEFLVAKARKINPANLDLKKKLATYRRLAKQQQEPADDK